MCENSIGTYKTCPTWMPCPRKYFKDAIKASTATVKNTVDVHWLYLPSHQQKSTVIAAISSVKLRGCIQNLCEYISFGVVSLRTGVSYKCGDVSSRCWLLGWQKIAFSKAQWGDVQEKLMLSGSQYLASHQQKVNSEDSSRRKLTGRACPSSKFPNIFEIYVSLNQMVFPPCRHVKTGSWWNIYEIHSQPIKRDVAFCFQHCPRALRTQGDSLYLEGTLYSSTEQTKIIWFSSNECPVQLLSFKIFWRVLVKWWLCTH